MLPNVNKNFNFLARSLLIYILVSFVEAVSEISSFLEAKKFGAICPSLTSTSANGEIDCL